MMTARGAAALAFAAALAAAAAGCASPTPSFYALGSSSVGAAPAPAANPRAPSVAVGPVTVPAVVDRPQMVIALGANQVQIDEFNRWAAPLGDNISGVLQAELARQLGTAQVWSQSLVGQPTPDLRVTIDVQRFDTRPGDAVRIDAFWSVQRTAGGTAVTGRSQVIEPCAAPGIEAAVAAHSRALAKVSRDIADAIGKR